MRSKLLRWLDRRKLRPRFAGEFDGSSLMAAFGQAGVGVFVAPSTMEDDIRSQYGVIPVGRTGEITAEYYAISVERRLSHPCVLAITRGARDLVFTPKPA
jgi:LysR family transcriptional activator of nhaA